MNEEGILATTTMSPSAPLFSPTYCVLFYHCKNRVGRLQIYLFILTNGMVTPSFRSRMLKLGLTRFVEFNWSSNNIILNILYSRVRERQENLVKKKRKENK